MGQNMQMQVGAVFMINDLLYKGMYLLKIKSHLLFGTSYYD